MFERRLKIFLGLLACFTFMLLLRAGWLQVVQGSEWQRKAAETSKRSSFVETSRGRILDYKGRVVAEDAPCIDAAVDFRAINCDAPESKEWLDAQARQRLSNRGALKGDKETKARLVQNEVEAIKQDLHVLWTTMAQVSGKTPDDIDAIRKAIIDRVNNRGRYVWYRKYEQAKERHEAEKREQKPGWFAWLNDDSGSGPNLDSFKVTVAEQTEAHAILRAIDNDAYIVLDKLRDRCPGLELRKGTRRNYPYHDVGCHVVGNLSPVTKEDRDADPFAEKDPTRKYLANDMIGRSGVERLAERTLRGARGSLVKVAGRDTVLDASAPVPGQDVRITLDMEMQMRIQEAFLRYEEKDAPDSPGKDLRVQQMRFHEMHGAAVVIDVPTGEVRALVSYPTYDVNQFDSIYAKLVKDYVNQPLLNRATQAMLEPGSTVKPMVGLSAISAGVARVDETVECTGYLVIDGRPRKEGRCWVASKFGTRLGVAGVAHHPIPWNAPHPTGFLTFADGLERSCNVFFETMADRLKMDGLGEWMGKFGLGHLTEIGIPEVAGRIPGGRKIDNARSATWFSGIGQSQVLATPIQMANVAATIARRGVWVRPHLLTTDTPDAEHRDLHLNQAAVDQAWQGMIAVVNGGAGTGKIAHPDGLLVAGKTGTAQAAKFNIMEYDEKGKPKRDENNRVIRRFPPPSTPEAPNPEMPWYRGSGNSGNELGHAWFIGFAPANNPKIAFAVLVEYGGAGGKDAGPIASAILEAAVEQEYIKIATPAAPPVAAPD